jgi:dimethylglycine dehydrogenase
MHHARAVVIGGGIVGCSALWHLARKGWKDLVLLERDELTAGSTWHAAGNCPNFSTSWALLNLQRYSTRLYRELGQLTGCAITYHVTGSIRLAQGRTRLEEYRHVAAVANTLDLGFELLPPDELKRRYPPLETAGLLGGLWDPGDGDIDPSQATQAFAGGARALGATILRGCPVTAMARRGEGWRLVTPQGEIQAEIVINTAGYRAGEVAALVGQRLPLVSLQHQYLVTEGLPELAGPGAKLPLLRDPDDSYYLRQERDGLLLGPYEKERAVAVWDEGIPPGFVAELFPDDLERLERYIELAVGRVPLLGQAGVKRVVNGPIPYTPDGNPLIGPAFQPGLDLRGLYLCCAFSFGIVQGGGAGKAIADIVAEGESEWDLWALDPRRFTGHCDRTYTRAKALELYQNEYAVSTPHQEWPAGRPARTTPLTAVLAAEGAVFGARNGWERPLWFRPAGFAGPTQATSFQRQPWFDAVAAECRAVREAAGLVVIPGFSRFRIEGPGSAAHLDRLLATPLPPVGQVRLAYGLTASGGVLVETTVIRLAEECFLLASAAAAEWHDWAWLAANLPAGVTLANVTTQQETLALSGPRSREILERASGASLADLRWRHARDFTVAGETMMVLRFGYSGELGYELHPRLEQGPAVYALLRAAGARPAGTLALDSLRLEKGYPAWKSELEIKVSALASGLERFIAWDKGDFVGRAALLAERAAGPRQVLALLALDPGETEALPLAPVWRAGRRVGLVTSGAFGHWVGRSLALAYLEPGEALVGTQLTVDVLGERRGALVVPRPLHDPENRRMKG